MAIALLTGDLMVQSRIDAAVQRGGELLRTASNVDTLLAKCAGSATTLVLLDLTPPIGDLGAVVERLRSLSDARPAVIAFGPHVHESLLAAAAEAGCDQVLSRGQFFAQIDAIVARAATDR